MSDFTAQDYRQLSESLERVQRNYESGRLNLGVGILKVMDAARRFRDRYQICQTCEESDQPGKQGCDHDHHIPGDTTNGCRMFLDCPDCVGGLVPNQERLEQAAKAIYDYGLPTATHDERGRRVDFDLSMTPGLFRKGAAAAVRAFDKEPTS